MFRPTQILQQLGKIIWRYATHHAKDGRRPEAEAAVKTHYKQHNLENRGVEIAEIRSAFHGGDGHEKEHVTVDFQDKDGKHVTTHHVRGPRDA